MGVNRALDFFFPLCSCPQWPVANGGEFLIDAIASSCIKAPERTP